MAKKEFNSELSAIYGSINQKQGSKAHPVVTKEEAEQRKKAAQTQGAKGAKMDRINMAFSMTTFCNYVIEQSRKENAELFEQAQAIIEKMGN